LIMFRRCLSLSVHLQQTRAVFRISAVPADPMREEGVVITDFITIASPLRRSHRHASPAEDIRHLHAFQASYVDLVLGNEIQ